MTVYRIVSVTRLHTSGEPAKADRFRLVCGKVPEPPPGAVIHPWSDAPLVKPPQKPVAVPLSPEQAALVPIKLREARQHRAIAQAERIRDWKQVDPLVPIIRTRSIRDHAGHLIRPPTAVDGVWRDPDDHNRSSRHAKEVRGRRSHDPLATLAKRNTLITEELIAAADCYRLAWELGPGGARPGYAPPLIRNAAFGPSSGPGDARIAGEVAWREVQRHIRDPRQILLLDHVVIRCLDVSAWAETVGWDRKAAVGYLIGVLETLAAYYRHEVAGRLRGDDPEIEQDRKLAAR